ncbi:MAG: hypothetical protein ACI82I_003224, partial [Gammaproteobacteria bacterium]
RGARAQRCGGLQDWQIKHEVHCPNPENSARDLHRDIGGDHFPRVFAAKGKGKRYDWVEMRTRDRPKRCDDHIKDAACSDSVSKQSHGSISVRQAFAHDPRAYDADQ